jgi:sugar lactone lactonase YvrE
MRRIELPGHGPGDVVIGTDGLVYAGVEDGRILRIDIETDKVDAVANTGGRPLGLHAGPDGSLLVCDAHRGLLRLRGPGRPLEVLADSVDGEALNVASNVVADPDGGTIY